jgi:hypothetical protein
LGPTGAKYLAYQLLPLAASFLLYTVVSPFSALSRHLSISNHLLSASHPPSQFIRTNQFQIQARRVKVRNGAVNSDASSKSVGHSEETTTLLSSDSTSDTDNATKPDDYYEPQSPLRVLAFFTTSVQFALALQLSGLTDPIRVISFLLLPLHKAFDPSLAFLAAGALPLAIGLYRYGRGNEIPALGGKWGIPKGGPIDLKLLTGAAIFGVGWGMAGICREYSLRYYLYSFRILIVCFFSISWAWFD